MMWTFSQMSEIYLNTIIHSRYDNSMRLHILYDNTLKNLIIDQESLIKILFAVDDWSSLNKLSFLDMNYYYISKN